MQVKNQTTTIPKVRIGIIQTSKQVGFKCASNFKILNDKNEVLISGHPNQNYSLKIASAKPAKLEYQIRVAVFKDLDSAEQKSQELKKQGQPTEIRKVGLFLTFADFEFDNSDYWVVVGNFSTREEALAYRDELGLASDIPIVEKIIRKASGIIEHNGQQLGDCIRIMPEDPETLIQVDEVPIGIEFHWQRTENLDYRGIIEVGFNNIGELVTINEVDIENYLASVNSSEMTPDCPLALLEAQTIAARSTVFATMGKHHYNTQFHLCSDDHCQCYQGAKREQAVSQEAMRNTLGETLISDGVICDARYSKICGGIMESYENVWDEQKIPYLVAGIDSNQKIEFPADTEERARALVDGNPDVFCNTNIYKLPEKLANLYSTKDLFRWEVRYDRNDLQKLIAKKLDTDFGTLIDLKPVNRGASGRLIYLDVVGSKNTIRVGKELGIRRILSESHLYSSCFYIERDTDDNGEIRAFVLKGGGWGHGVGLCQVGATVMALKGYSYPDILVHYFKNSDIKKLY
ncbi:SpoIID/LytB domain-containing protein [candidate division KSB1 bacterium]|nr:SpoIID/LytB domain-containing protein [candidate division KSB1 bacterium]